MKSITFRKLTDKMAFCGKAFNKLHIMPISILFFKIKDKIVLNYIKKQYSNFISNYKPCVLSPKKQFENLPIWVCWLQGEENAPALVKKCISSIRQHANGHEVIVLTENNIKEYIDIPEYIVKNVQSGILSRTSYSDIVRSALLASYGGMWIDATFFLTQDLPENYFSYSIFSAAKQPEPKDRRNVCISRYRWTGSFIGASSSNNKLFCFLRDFLYEYEKREVVFIDYLFIDYLIYVAYKNFEEVNSAINAIPDNNLDFGWLFHVMNKPFDEEKAKTMFEGKTFAYKLSWKMNWKTSVQGKETFFGNFISEVE